MDAAWIVLVLIAAGVNALPAEKNRQTQAGPVQHTANFAGQAGWSGSPATTAPAASSYDRYGNPINAARSTLPPPPTITSGAQSTFNSANASLRDGVESGIRAANQQFGTASPFTSSTTPPSIAASQQGWTSIGTSVPAPPLLIPKSPMSTSNFGNTSSGTTTGSTLTFPASTTNIQQPLHSVLAEPQRPATPSATDADWGNAFSNTGSGQPATIGRSNSAPSLGSTVRDSDLVPLPISNSQAQDPRNVVAARPNSGFPEGDTWAQAGQASLGSQNGGIGSAGINRQTPSNGMSNNQFSGQPSQQMPNPGNNMGGFNAVATNPNTGQGMGGQVMGTMGNGMNQNGQYQNGQLVQNGRAVPLEQTSWFPMVVAVLGLAGSLAANLFLGMSYLDARQKYQSLVRKTADTFRRVKSVAA